MQPNILAQMGSQPNEEEANDYPPDLLLHLLHRTLVMVFMRVRVARQLGRHGLFLALAPITRNGCLEEDRA